MGEPKLRPEAARLSARYPAGVLENPKPIAQRFAYSADLREAALRPAEVPRVSPPMALRAEPEIDLRPRGEWRFQPRFIAAGGVAAAMLLLGLLLGAFWLGRSGAPALTPSASSPTTQTASPSAVLTTPGRIEVRAGEAASVPIALDGTDGVPPRSVIAIKGLPPGSNLSEGRPFGDSEWTLKPDEIGDLTLVPSAGAKGEFKLGITLVSPDDKVIAAAETVLVVAPLPAAPAATAPVAPAPVEASSASASGTGEAALPVPDPANVGTAAPAPPATEGAEAAAITPAQDTEEVGAAEPEQSSPTPKPANALSDASPADQVQPPDAGKSAHGSVKPAVFVNLREAPSYSATVLGVVAKGADLPVLDRKRGWVQVTDPASGKQGWVYSGLLEGAEAAKTDRRVKRVGPAKTEAEAEPKSDSLWSRLGRWLSPSQEKPPQQN